jgi:hypothetical protein
MKLETVFGQPFLQRYPYLLCVFPMFEANQEVSSPGESHPQALSEPDVNLSAHPAPIIQSTAESPFSSEQTARNLALRGSRASILLSGDGVPTF